MKKIFVLTDNEIQYEGFKLIIKELRIKDKFCFYCSPNSKFKDKNVAPYNVKSAYQFILDNYDIAFSMHSKQLFPKQLVDNMTCINIHPGYNPYNRGWYPQVFAIIEDNVIGATIHLMDSELDNGDIIARKEIKKFIWDTSETLYKRILDEEIRLLKENLIAILNNNYKTIKPEEKGNLYLRKDFYDLREIDLNSKGTFKDFYNHLRALTFDNYKNAYFIDEQTGEKIYLQVKIQK